MKELFEPSKLWSRAEILAGDCPVPKKAGAYAWYFREIPPGVPTDGCKTKDGRTLLYVGVSPSGPKSKSGQLQKRILKHMRGTARGSTLRYSLGCLLSESLGISLQKGPTGYSLGDGEDDLDDWLDDNASICWVVRDKPWEVESEIIAACSAPLNLDHNTLHSFYPVLKAIRDRARKKADEDAEE